MSEPYFLRDPGADGVGVAFVSDIGREATDGAELAAEKRAGVAQALGVGRIIAVHQVHGREVVTVDSHHLERAGEAPQADALVTTLRTSPPVALSIHTADCVPVVLADPAAGVVGAAHAGRQGFAAGVLPATVDAMRALGATSIRAWIGPHVCGRCYEVPAEMRDEVGAQHPAAVAETSWGTPALDLGAGVEAQLTALGCAVERVDGCTLETASLPSHRRDAQASGRLGALVWLA